MCVRVCVFEGKKVPRSTRTSEATSISGYHSLLFALITPPLSSFLVLSPCQEEVDVPVVAPPKRNQQQAVQKRDQEQEEEEEAQAGPAQEEGVGVPLHFLGLKPQGLLERGLV